MAYATVDDIALLWRTLTDDEQVRAEALIEVVTSTIRIKAASVGKDLDEMAENSEDYANVLKSVIVDVVSRILLSSTENEPMTQMTQSAGGYSYSGTYLSPGGGVYIKPAEYAKLGLATQRAGALNIYG